MGKKEPQSLNLSGGESDFEVWNSKPRRLSEIWKRDRDTKTVVALGLKGIVQMNPVGSAIWLWLDGEHTISNIVEELVMKYSDQDPCRIKTEIISFINLLLANHLVILGWHPL